MQQLSGLDACAMQTPCRDAQYISDKHAEKAGVGRKHTIAQEQKTLAQLIRSIYVHGLYLYQSN